MICIPNMKMPKSCEECPLYKLNPENDQYYPWIMKCNAMNTVFDCMTEKTDDKGNIVDFVIWTEERRHEDCPLIYKEEEVKQ